VKPQINCTAHPTCPFVAACEAVNRCKDARPPVGRLTTNPMPSESELAYAAKNGLYWEDSKGCYLPRDKHMIRRTPIENCAHVHNCPDLDQELPDEFERAGLERLQEMDAVSDQDLDPDFLYTKRLAEDILDHLMPTEAPPEYDATAALLSERGKTHGDYSMVAKVSHEIKEAMHWGPRELSDGQSEALDMIAMKIARIVCGNPNEPDHWDDIAGYARLGKGSSTPHI